MSTPRVVTIDLGSAYTKVAVRQAWDSPANLIYGLPLASERSSFVIPSAVAHVNRRGREEWLCGIAAAQHKPVEGTTIYSNWKAALFQSQSNIGRQRNDQIDTETAKRVAVRFLASLREALTRVHNIASRLPARLCIPSLNDGDPIQALIDRILRDAGWAPAPERPYVFEPEANALGVASRGRNATWRPPVRDYRPLVEREIHMQRMLEPWLAKAFRRMRDSYGLLVTDVGAFTTDFGFVQFDSSFHSDDWNRPTIVQRSFALGIRELDAEVRSVLSRASLEAVHGMSSDEWDKQKISLYAGKSVAVRGRAGVTYIGADAEGHAIKDKIKQFAERIYSKRSEFCSAYLSARVDAETLTGGGVLIAPLREILTRRIQEEGVEMVDLVDNSGEDEARARENLELVRGGTAIGGCSVFFE